MFWQPLSLLGTNFALSLDEASQIRDILLDKEADLARLEHAVISIQAHSEELLAKRDEARSSIDAHRALLSPIRQMPLEVMQEIFVHCLPNDQYVRPDACKAPLLLGQVCAPWRRAVLATPRLWSSLAIQLSHRNSGRRLSLMKSWISRSSGHPISLFVYIPMADEHIANMFVGILHSHLHRLKNLRLTLPHHCRTPVLEALAQGTPLLESLQMRFSPTKVEDTPLSSGKLLVTGTSAPRLRAVSWSSQGIERVLFSLHVTHLTDLDVDYPLSVAECLGIMKECPKLINCEFRAVSAWENTTSFPIDVSASLPIVLSEVRALSLQTTQALDIFFDCLELPALETLKVVDMGLETDFRVWSQSTFNGFIARSGCLLQRLHLLNVLSSEDDLIQCLQRSCSSLIELRLLDLKGVTVVMDRVLDLLTVRETSEGQVACLCPKLEVMKLGTSLASSDGVLARMVESRLSCDPALHWQVVRLKSINPRLDMLNNPEDVRRLAELRNKGLELF